MSAITIQIEKGIAGLLAAMQQPVAQAAREFIVMELYRRGNLSRGRGAELLGMNRIEFVPQASDLGIPYLQMGFEDLDRELEAGLT